MKKVYLLVFLPVEDDMGWIEGVFNTKEGAEKAVREWAKNRYEEDMEEGEDFMDMCKEGTDYEINEYTLEE
jgi:hypothetical protein